VVFPFLRSCTSLRNSIISARYDIDPFSPSFLALPSPSPSSLSSQLSGGRVRPSRGSSALPGSSHS
jgi:hypothetical protein